MPSRKIHWEVWNNHNPENKIITGDGYVIHHKNFNHYDNRIENLQKLTPGEHCVIHRFGTIHSENTRLKMSKNHANVSGENNPMYGKHHTEESKRKNSKSRKGKCSGRDHPFYGIKGKNHPNFGRKHTKECRKKQSKSSSGYRNSQARPTIVEYILFRTLKEAAENLNISRVAVRNRIKRKVCGYMYLEDFNNLLIEIIKFKIFRRI